MKTTRGKAELRAAGRMARCLPLILLGSAVFGGVPVAGQDIRTPDPLVAEELRQEALPVILAMARHILSAEAEAQRVDVAGVALPWRGALEVFEGRRGIVAIAVGEGWETLTRWYVPELADLLPELSGEVAAQLSAEGYPVRGAFRHRVYGPEPEGRAGRAEWTRTEWRDHDEALLVACRYERVRPEERVPGARMSECNVYDDIELVVQIGYPVLGGPYMDAPVTLTRSSVEVNPPGRRTDTGFTLRAERGPEGWFVSAVLPQMVRDGPLTMRRGPR